MIAGQIIDKIAKELETTKINNEFYNTIDEVMDASLKVIAYANKIGLNNLNYFMAGDHVIGTNLNNNSA